MLPDQTCPCGAGTYGDCCGRVLSGVAPAGTPEELMRSRYTAFVLGDARHLLASWHPSTRPAGLALDPAQRWTGLQVLSASGGLFDSTGTVEFEASWRSGRATGVLHERSGFVREGGRWLYVGPVG